MEWKINSIGTIYSPFKTKEDCPIQGNVQPESKGTVEVFEELSRSDAGGVDTSYSLALSYRTWADLKSLMEEREDALKLYAQARDLMKSLGEKNPSVPEYRAGLAEICMNAGDMEHAAGRHGEAVSSLSLAVELLALSL